MGIAFSAASLACQSAMCACSMAQCCFSSARGTGGLSQSAAKVMYILMLGIATFVALLLRYNGDALNLSFYGAFDIHCSNGTDHQPSTSSLGVPAMDSSSVSDSIKDAFNSLTGATDAPILGTEAPSGTYIYCKGDAAVYRISFVLAIFFAVVGVLSSVSDAFHRGWWGPKLIVFFILLIGCFFIPNNVFDNSGYAWVARVFSTLFLLLQILALIDFGFQWNEDWIRRSDEGGEDGESNSAWLYGILACAGALYSFAIGLTVYMFITYDDCGVSVVITSLMFASMVGFTALSLFRDKIVGEEFEGAVLPASVVASYCVYLCWSALESNPDSSCKPPRESSGSENTSDMTIGIVIATVSLMWTTYSASRNAQELLSGETATPDGVEGTIREPLYRVAVGGSQDEEYGATSSQMHRSNMAALEMDGDDDSDSQSTAGLWLFHLTMMTASMYMAMLLTNWGANEHQEGNKNGTVGFASMWVKAVSQWLTAGLYSWTLVAPHFMPDRDWM